MQSTGKLHGGVIIDHERRTHGIIKLLSLRVAGKIEFTFYDHPNSIETQRPHQFVIVLTLTDLHGVVRHYEAKNCPLPLIIHLDRPEILGSIDYATLLPGVAIVPVEQAAISDRDITLQLDVFERIMSAIETSR